MSSISIKITGNESVLTGGILSFAKANGWEETVLVDGEQVPNPITAHEFCSAPIATFFLDKIIEGAQKEAERLKIIAIENSRAAFSTVTFSVKQD